MSNPSDVPGFEMPTAREIELDLALASPSWQSLLPGAARPFPYTQSPTPIGVPGTSPGRRSLYGRRRVRRGNV